MASIEASSTITTVPGCSRYRPVSSRNGLGVLVFVEELRDGVGGANVASRSSAAARAEGASPTIRYPAAATRRPRRRARWSSRSRPARPAPRPHLRCPRPGRARPAAGVQAAAARDRPDLCRVNNCHTLSGRRRRYRGSAAPHPRWTGRRSGRRSRGDIPRSRGGA